VNPTRGLGACAAKQAAVAGTCAGKARQAWCPESFCHGLPDRILRGVRGQEHAVVADRNSDPPVGIGPGDRTAGTRMADCARVPADLPAEVLRLRIATAPEAGTDAEHNASHAVRLVEPARSVLKLATRSRGRIGMPPRAPPLASMAKKRAMLRAVAKPPAPGMQLSRTSLRLIFGRDHRHARPLYRFAGPGADNGPCHSGRHPLSCCNSMMVCYYANSIATFIASNAGTTMRLASIRISRTRFACSRVAVS
jgi:hypothetical protein